MELKVATVKRALAGPALPKFARDHIELFKKSIDQGLEEVLNTAKAFLQSSSSYGGGNNLLTNINRTKILINLY